MNVYDFDKTITEQDSSMLFIRYAMLKYPMAFRDNMQDLLLAVFSYALHSNRNPSHMKEVLFRVVSYIPDIDSFVAEFWSRNRDQIKQWYLDRKSHDDVIISASPEFLLAPMAEELGVTLIATPMSSTSGCIQGINCKGDEKVRRFREIFPDAEVDEFYSDSLSDTPMAELARRAYLVKGSPVSTWPFK